MASMPLGAHVQNVPSFVLVAAVEHDTHGQNVCLTGDNYSKTPSAEEKEY